MKKILCIISAFVALSCSGTIYEQPSAGENLGTLVVGRGSGKQSIYVNMTSEWQVRSLSSWISLDVSGRSSESAFTISYQSNESGLLADAVAREGQLLLINLSDFTADTLTVFQPGLADGTVYETQLKGNKLELQYEEFIKLSVIYANLQGKTFEEGETIISSRSEDIKAIIWDVDCSKKYAEAHPDDCVNLDNLLIVGTAGDFVKTDNPASIIANLDGINIQLADFASFDAEGRTSFNQMRNLLDSGFNSSGMGGRWIIGGSFYYYSLMETGYDNTPQWYPRDVDSELFLSDRLVWESNLIDCIWMVSRMFNPTYSDGEKSWRADYVYTSREVWNGADAVSLIENPELQHSMISLTLNISAE